MVTPHALTPTAARQNISNRGLCGLTRLFASAVISRAFRDLLLADPRAAVRAGYQGQPFDLTDEEQQLLFSIRAESLTDLARQVNRALKSR